MSKINFSLAAARFGCNFVALIDSSIAPSARFRYNGSMGIFVRRLSAFGFSSVQIVSIRVTRAALVFCILLLAKNHAGFRISLRDIPLFIGLGFGSILFFTVCYFTAITMMPLSTAAILLYTSPIWIMLMSALFFHEKLNGRKLLALVLAFAGCVLVSGISGEGVTPAGLLLGLGSGVGYGLYSILGTIALRRYSPYTVTTYTFAFAAVGSWLICRPADMISNFSGAASLAALVFFCCLTAIVTAVVPFLFYTLGLQTAEAGRAGILATVEPMVATFFSNVPISLSPSLSSRFCSTGWSPHFIWNGSIINAGHSKYNHSAAEVYR